jgi:hypothetical protein
MATYYISNSGSDGNAGTSSGSPWQTISKVNGFSFTAGDIVQFNGGQTFTGALVNTGQITYQSYGTGRAIISSGSSSGFYSLNLDNFSVLNLIFVGSGVSTSTVDGIHIENSQSGNTKLQNVTINNVDVSQYGFNGISIQGTNGASGFNNLQILGCSTHDCTGGFGNGNGSAGIIIQGSNYGSGLTAPNHTNILIDHCISYNNIGFNDPSNWTGSGIVIGESSGGTIQYCTAYNNGLNAHGTVGIWCFDSANLIFQYCEAYLTLTVNGTDGDGFDIDGACYNIIMQYCYAHDNQGSGFQIYTYNDGIVTNSDNCTVRYCISQNDGTYGNAIAGSIMIGNDGGNLTNIFVYNNTFFQNGNISNPKLIVVEGSAGSITGYVANNVLYSNNGANFITSSNTPVLSFVGNGYYGTGTLNWQWGGTTYNTFSAWQTASGQEKISGSNVGKTANPLLMSPGNGGIINAVNSALIQYRLNSASTIIGQGLNLVTLYSLSVGSHDFYGNSIPNSGGNYDIGATQYKSLQTHGKIVLA